MMTSFKNITVKATKKAAFLLSLMFVSVLAVSSVFGCVFLLNWLFSFFPVATGVRVIVCELVIIGPALEFAINIANNALAIVSRLFPDRFHRSIPFECVSFWGRMAKNTLL